MSDWKTLKVECIYCHKKDKFQGTSFKVAVIGASGRGWKYDKNRGWICPECVELKKRKKENGKSD
jgi:hypothetical protein